MTRFSIVPEHSELAVEGRSSVHPIHGEAGRLSGWIEAVVVDGEVDATQPAGAYLELRTTDLRADNRLINRELQRRLDPRRYPSVRAEINDVAQLAPGRYRVRGTLSFHGVTREMTAEAAATVDEHGRISVAGETSLDVRDFDLDPPKMLGLRVEPEVAVHLTALAVPQG